MSNCKVCDRNTMFLGNARIMGKHLAEFRCCINCGFIQVENPCWIEEAYKKVMTDGDTGLVRRNFIFSKLSYTLIKLGFGKKGRFIDYGAGYGLFVRLMRDQGLDYFWHDKFSENLFAAGYEAKFGTKYDLLTAFEVFEHFLEPRKGLEEMLQFSNSIFFSTSIVPVPTPKPDQWFYYGIEHGQHLSFYTKKSLEILGEENDLSFYTKGNYLHLFSRRNINPIVFAIATNPRLSRIVSLFG